MILTPINESELPTILRSFQGNFPRKSIVECVFSKIARSWNKNAKTSSLLGSNVVLSLVKRMEIPIKYVSPRDGFSWDGSFMSIKTEASVIIHEIAHWLVAPCERREIPEFGLGAGPETGLVAQANSACSVGDYEKHTEELLASLLGIIMEAELGFPALSAFIEQNWLEAWERPVAAIQFSAVVEQLFHRGLINNRGVTICNQVGSAAIAEISIRNSGHAKAETSTIAEAGPSFGK